MARVLILLPTATYRAPDFVRAAATVGAEVVVGSEQRQALADAMGDRALVVPLRDPAAAVEAIADLHRRSPIDAVLAVDDQGVLIAAMAGQRLGLVHNPPDAAAAARDKVMMRERLAAAGVAQPAFRVARVGAGATDEVGALASEIGWPVVVKPVSLSASRGVIRADTADEARAAGVRIRRILDQAGEDAEGPLLVERFIAGREVAVEGLLEAGDLRVLAVFDKPDPLEGPYFEETIYVTPSRLEEPALAAVRAVVDDAARAIGLREGPIHAEARVTSDGGACLLELAARSIGGLCSRSLRFGLGVSLEELIIRHALDLDVDDLLEREATASGVMMLPIPRAGVLEAVRGQDKALGVAGVVGLEITIRPGRPVTPLPEGDRYLGFAFARGATPQEVEESLRAAHACLDVAIAPGR